MQIKHKLIRFQIEEIMRKGQKNMRKLASIQRIWEIEPIAGADRIELASVLGWKCVVNKGQFKKYDLAVYFEVDSFLPIREEFEFLRNSSFRNSQILGEGFKLRTMKFKGQISQGLLLPISSFKELDENIELGSDVTGDLKVRKWEIEERVTTGGTVKGLLPSFIPHTDETRVQAEPTLIYQFNNIEYYISTKMDGSSHSIGVDKHGVHITGHNYEYKDDDSNDFFIYAKKNDYINKIKEYYDKERLDTLIIQGEFCGPGIQSNPVKLIKPQWYVFTVIENGKRVDFSRMIDICGYLGLRTVPIEEIGFDLPHRYPDVESLLKRAEGKYETGGPKEGIVIRPTTTIYCDIISSNLSMKVVSNSYLLSKK